MRTPTTTRGNPNRTTGSLEYLHGEPLVPLLVPPGSEAQVFQCKVSKSLPIMTGDETPEDIIIKHNQYFREHNKLADQEVESSISTTGSTESAAIRARRWKISMARRTFVFGCVLCWLINLAVCIFWFYTFFIWPMSFAREILNNEKAKEEAEHGRKHFNKWAVVGLVPVLIANLNTYFIGAWGIVGAYCGRERILKSFILRVPWALVISVFYGVQGVNFAGALSNVFLEGLMQRDLGQYYKTNRSREAWDKMQYYLQCCGIDSKADWALANANLVTKFPESCCHSSTGTRERNVEKLLACQIDPVGTMIWERGCEKPLFEFYIYVGAAVAAIEFFSVGFIILAVALGFRYYTKNRRHREKHFHYPVKEYFIDFFFMRTFYERYKKRQLAKIQADPQQGPSPAPSEMSTMEPSTVRPSLMTSVENNAAQPNPAPSEMSSMEPSIVQPSSLMTSVENNSAQPINPNADDLSELHTNTKGNIV